MFGLCVLVSELKLAMVSDITQLNPLPKVICALKAWKGDDEKSSVVENDLLVVKQVSLISRVLLCFIIYLLIIFELEFWIQCVCNVV